MDNKRIHSVICIHIFGHKIYRIVLNIKPILYYRGLVYHTDNIQRTPFITIGYYELSAYSEMDFCPPVTLLLQITSDITKLC